MSVTTTFTKQDAVRVKFENKAAFLASLKKTDDRIAKDLVREVVRLTLRLEKEAKGYAPVDTGRLRANIHSEIEASGLVGRATSDVDYAVHVHEGTRFRSGRPYMLLALRQVSRHLGGVGKDVIDKEAARWASAQRRG